MATMILEGSVTPIISAAMTKRATIFSFLLSLQKGFFLLLVDVELVSIFQHNSFEDIDLIAVELCIPTHQRIHFT